MLFNVVLYSFIVKCVADSDTGETYLMFVSTLQQFKNIKHLTDFQVEEYYGAKGVDSWDLKTWEKEISNNDVCSFISLLIGFSQRYFSLPFFVTDLCSIVLAPIAFSDALYYYI